MNLLNILYIFVICASCVEAHPPGRQMTTHPGSAARDSIIGNPVPGAHRTDAYLDLIRGKKIGCVVNQSSLVGRTHLVDTLLRRGVDVKVIFSPEHGFRGTADAGQEIAESIDSSTGIPVISLYGDHRKPTPEDLAGLEVILFDLQDVGVRCYTYISTLHLVMEACAENHIPFIVLDRPNPNGYYIDGPMLRPEFRSFVGMDAIPLVYGMTIGELAQMINGEGWLNGGIKCHLTVIPCIHYDHNMTCTLSVPPSPNLPNLRAILLYPSLCLFEGTQVSVGRGTKMQFQIIGHPAYLPGSTVFTPESMPGAVNPPYEGMPVNGTSLRHLSTAEIFSWKKLNLFWLLNYYQVLQPQGKFFTTQMTAFDRHAGSSALRVQLGQNLTEQQIRASWQADIEAFRARRSHYLLYPDIR